MALGILLFVSFVLLQGQHVLGGGHKLAMYWGQASAGNTEWDMDKLCEYGKMDIIPVGFITKFWDERDKDKLPYINLSHHCWYSLDPNHPYLWSCKMLGWNARICQNLGKKILISMGGDTVAENLGSPAKARQLAQTIWDLFLGGTKYYEDTRPFGSVVLDGVDLNIEKGSPYYYPDFIRELRRLMATDPSKDYLITGAPQCPYPDYWLGPEVPGKALADTGHMVDYLFIQYYNNYCYPDNTGGGKDFDATLEKWLAFAQKAGKPKILVGLPAGPYAANKADYYKSPSAVQAIYKRIKDKPNFGGFMLWDSSWDQINIINGKRYSSYLYDMMAGSVVPTAAPTDAPTAPPTQPPPPTTQPPPPVTTQPPPPPPTTQPPVTSSPGGTVDCSSLADGLYKDPKDCQGFIQCAGGTAYYKKCAPGLLWNDVNKSCDWPHNVQC